MGSTSSNISISPEDQKILEEEFAKNSRPDKATRLHIVSRVTLGEKEVQIWFQNRRQNTRKKSKSANESSELSSDGLSDNLSTDMSPDLAPTTNTPQLDSAETSQEGSIATHSIAPATESQGSILTSFQSSISVLPTSQNQSSSQGLGILSQTSSTAGYIANRRIMTSREAEEEDEYLISQRQIRPAHSRNLSRSGSSILRISLTDDGKAKVVDRGAKSPPKQQSILAPPTHTGSLRRSYSAAGLQERPKSIDGDLPDPARKIPRVQGRSRDSRTWEFWCDSDARNSLHERAQQEGSGSATEALSLIRSNSSRALKQNNNKMNSPNPGRFDSSGPIKKARPPLRKSLTHVGIVSTASTKPKGKGSKKVIDTEEEEEDYDHLNSESDKENYNPTPRGPRTVTQKESFIRTSTKVLGENDTLKSTSSSLGNLMTREQRQKSRSSRSKPARVDDEVAAFMGGSGSEAGSGSGIAREEDLNCVQGLLSLSQGNWV